MFFFKKRDQRKHPRVNSFNLIRLRQEGSQQQDPWYSVFNITNLSEGGLQFMSYHRIKPQMELQLILNLAEFEQQYPVDVKVMWVRKKLRLRPVYHAGVSFLMIPDEAKQAIRRLVSPPTSAKAKDKD